MTKRRGRPSKFTEATRMRILAAVRAGAPYTLACSAAGVSYRAFREWIARAESGDAEPQFLHFLQRLRMAEAESALVDLETIRRASGKHWQAAAWRLERRFPESFARRDALKRPSEVEALPDPNPPLLSNDQIIAKLRTLFELQQLDGPAPTVLLACSHT